MWQLLSAFASLKFCIVPGRDGAEVRLSLKQQGLRQPLKDGGDPVGALGV